MADKDNATEEKVRLPEAPELNVPKVGEHRTKYTHLNCETDNVMSEEIEGRYYSGEPVTSLFCSHCGCGIRIGRDGEMVWTGSKEKVPVIGEV